MTMERGSTKHGPRLDEEMAFEVQSQTTGGAAGSRAEEWREPEPSGDDQPDNTWALGDHLPGGAPPGMTREEVQQRSELGRYIASALPADRDALIVAVQEAYAPDHILDQVRQLPEQGTFDTVNQVWAALGHANESTRA